ncbi:hypothetical protein Taro_021367 [Colocasia esculenta]|uniref:DUF4005 domain-containing protein n=1 Tax=Colocasia esculenta TaxID=4460 RepID=A0A843VB88_COLES|nr:hypothetical protein [Colocasia esculenta]
MGKAARWLRGLLLGGKKQAAVGEDAAGQPKEKRRWGFARSFRDKEPHRREDNRGAPSAETGARKGASSREATRSYASSSIASSHSTFGPSSRAAVPAPALDEEEQSKRAIAVAAATAAVAEAAVAAAQAAAAVVRLTSSGRCPGLYGGAGRKAEWAAVKIQASFRGYLVSIPISVLLPSAIFPETLKFLVDLKARRALRALRGLVKLQALVRGHIVRKQAAETLRCMHALVRVQARARVCRALTEKNHRRMSPLQTHPGPPTPEKFEPSIRAGGVKHDRGSNLKSNNPRPGDADSPNPGRFQSSYNWLDRWMEERYSDSREVSSRTGATADDERNDKILEVDPGKPHLKPKRRASHHSSSTLASEQNSRSFATLQDSPSKDSTTAQFSIPSPSSVEMQHSLSPLRFAAGDGEPCESPQFYSATSRPGSARRGPFTPTKSDCSRGFFSVFADYPNYMANTESSRAKVRSQSAPRQRPDYEKLSSINRANAAAAAAGGGQSSSSSSQRSSSLHLKFTSKAYPGSGRLDRLGMPIRY